MKKFFTNKYFLTFLGILLFFAIWFLVYLIGGQNVNFFPSPIETFKEMFIYLGDPYTYECIWGSFYRMLIGFIVATILGILVGSIVGNFTSLKHVFNPTIVALKAVPTAALIFIFLKLAGLKNAPIFVVSLIVFPIVYEAAVSGHTAIPDQIIMASRVDGGTKVKTALKIKFPLAMPYITLGLIASFTLSFKIEIMAEVISGSSANGIGRAIRDAYINSTNGLVPTFAYALISIIVMLVVTLIIDIVKKILKRKGLVA